MGVKKESHLGTKPRIYATIIFLIIIGWSILIYYTGPEKIIEYIGTENGYLVVFVAGLLGGISIFFPFPYYLLVITFGGGGLNPYLLGLFTSVGIVLGECTSYFFGHSAHSFLSKGMEDKAHKLNNWLVKKPKFIVSVILFLWASLIPIPNDFFLVPFGLIRYPFWRVIIPLALGSFIFNTILAITGNYGLGLLFGYY
jgi:membrane protein YqaA with SNARE-associated domain